MAGPLRGEGGLVKGAPGHYVKENLFGTFFPTYKVPTAIKLEGRGGG